ncbi:ABC transporter permease [Undibacterium sp. Jales W-56]|uniref:FtsX-like permease family protein n=1 Tax=Undibacterium sp. Jales W-56 TaxID=2897325 RepID=UPI0021D08B81|nr:FtsX-like permease family protein [Undibacterium sp. Jales W-56]MCU6435062.1 ABC transporter permease [Undibacterium sp. Jales W-56]
MKLRDFRIGWRVLAQEPVYSAVTILGLGIGLAVCLLMLGFVRYAFEYNAQVPDVDQVYVIKHRYNVDPAEVWFDEAPLALREAAMKIPGVVDITGYLRRPADSIRAGNRLTKLKILPVLPRFADMLGVQVIEGDLKAALERPENLAITEASALQIFGKSQALGLRIQAGDKLLRVAAILRNPPDNTTIPYKAMVGLNSILLADPERTEALTGAYGSAGKLFIRLQPGSSIAAITATLQDLVDHAPGVQNNVMPDARERLGKRKVMDLSLSPLRDAYFDREVANNPISLPGDRGDPVVIKGLTAIALLILVLAAINYVNLATIRTLRRQREIGMRKVLGAGTRQLILQFLAESLLVSLLATGLGLLLAYLALPLFAELMNRKLESVLSVTNITAAVAIGILLGVLSAIYPAWIAIRTRPSQVLAGRPGSESAQGRQLRRLLTVLQIATAMGLASVTIAIAWQADFAIRAAPGFDPAQILVIDLPEPVKDSKNAHGLMAALAQKPDVAGTAISADAVGRYINPWLLDIRLPGGARIAPDMKSVSANFFDIYQIKPLAGRLFDTGLDKEDDAEPMVLNTVAVRQLGFSSPEAAVGKILVYTLPDGKLANKRIIGIAPELRFHSLHEIPRAIAYELWTAGTTLSIRSRGSLTTTEHTVQSLWANFFPDKTLDMHHAQQILDANYDEEQRLTTLLAISTGIALAIAAFGTYALSAYTVQRREKEIALRKLYGARKRHISRLVMKEIGTLTLVSAMIGLPIAAFLIELYLASYIERAPIAYWTLLLSLAWSCAIALIAVLLHAKHAMSKQLSLSLHA